MKTVLLSIPAPTSRKIARGLRVTRFRKTIPVYADVAIRWGSTKSFTPSGLELNKREAILLSSDKPETRRVLREAKLPVPKESETKFPIIGRSRKHKAGDNFFYCENAEQVEQAKAHGAVYFSEFYPKKNEYRVHVASGRVLLMSVKEGDKTQIIWNKAKSNFKFRHMRRSEWLNDDKLRDICRKAKKAVKALGLDFGAVDVMADAGEGHAPFVITEVNTAPNLSPLALSKYINYFNEQIESFENGDDDEDEE